MDVQIEQKNELTKTITVKIPVTEVAQEIQTGLESIRKTHRQRGFRPGKVPMSIIQSRFGASVQAQVAERTMQRTLNEVLASHGDVVHITQPELLTRDLGTQGLSYRFDAESLPKLEPQGYTGLKIQRPAVEADAEELQRRLEAIQQENAYDQPIEKEEVEEGDRVQVRYTFEGSTGAPRELTFTVGSQEAMPAFHEAVRGHKKGDEFTFTLGGVEGVPGSSVSMTVVSLMERVVPSLDDDLAKDDGRAETLEGLTEVLRKEIASSKEDEASRYAEEQLLKALLAANPFELPEGFFEAQLVNEVRARLRSMLGVDDPSKFGLDIHRLKEQWRDSIRLALKRVMLLEALALKEEVKVDEAEIEARIEEIAAGQKNDAQGRQVRSYYRQAQNRRMLERELLLQKTSEWVMERAEVETITWEAMESARAEEAAASVKAAVESVSGAEEPAEA